MRTLNKTLALVLALVMVLGMFGVASAADFTDDETIQYKEAVGVMTGIGAINGMGDGTFAPTGNVTRAQAAKMVAYAVLGADVAAALPTMASSFTDVDSNFAWAIPSIEYLVTAGVIDGRGDGTFDPNGNVTAYEIAKMLLAAAGYGQNGEFTGSSWALNVAVVAQKNGVFAGTKATDLNAAATREECALYCFSGLTKVDQVNWSKDEGAYVSASTTPTNIAEDVYGYTGKAGNATDGYVYQVTAVELDHIKTSGTYGKLIATAKNIAVPATAADVEFVVDSYDVVGNMFSFNMGTVDTKPVVYYAAQLTTEVAAPVGATAQAAFTKTYNLAAQTAPIFENYEMKAAPVAVATYTNWNSVAVVMPDTNKDGYDEIVAVKSVNYDIKVLSTTANMNGKYVATIDGVTVANETLATPVNAITTDIDFSKYTEGGLVQVMEYIAYGTTSAYEVLPTTFTVGVPVKLDTANSYTMKTGASVSKSAATVSTGATLALTGKGYTDTTPTLQSTTDEDPTNYIFFLDANGNYFAADVYSGATSSTAYYATYVYNTTNDFGAAVYKVQAVDVAGELQTFTVTKVTADTLVGGTYNTPAVVNGGYKVTLNATTGIASFDALDAEYNTEMATENTAIEKNEIVLETASPKSYYMNENTKFIFVNPAAGAAPTFAGNNAIVVKTGVSEVVGQKIPVGSVMYYAKTTSDNKTVSTVIVEGAFNPAAASATTGIIFVPAEATATASVSGANYYTVYLDGVKTTDFLVSYVNITPTDAAGVKLPAGFYSYSTVKGTAVLADYVASSTAGCTAKTGEEITNYYNGLFTTSTFANTSFEGATIVDLRTEVAAGTETAINTTSGLASLVAVSKNMSKAVTIAASYPISAAGNGTPTVVYILGVA